jgi:hypothetical protein
MTALGVVLAACSTIIAGILGSVTTIFIARRQNSGEIKTSEAATLWAESQSIRKEQREELRLVKNDLAELQARYQDSLDLNDLTLARLTRAEEDHQQCREDVRVLTAELERLKLK